MSNTPKKHMGMKNKERISNTIIYIILIAMSIVWLIPFIFLVLLLLLEGINISLNKQN